MQEAQTYDRSRSTWRTCMDRFPYINERELLQLSYTQKSEFRRRAIKDRLHWNIPLSARLKRSCTVFSPSRPKLYLLSINPLNQSDHARKVGSIAETKYGYRNVWNANLFFPASVEVVTFTVWGFPNMCILAHKSGPPLYAGHTLLFIWSLLQPAKTLC